MIKTTNISIHLSLPVKSILLEFSPKKIEVLLCRSIWQICQLELGGNGRLV